MTAGKLVAVALIAAAFGAGALVQAEASRPRLRTATFDPPYPERNAGGAPIRGVYEGRMPCVVAACARLKVQLVLYGGSEGAPASYWLALVGTAGNDRLVSEGAVSAATGIAGYPEARLYRLEGPAAEGLSAFWQVSDDVLLPLDETLHPRPGNGAFGTMLSRYDAPYGPRTYVWEG